MKTKNILRVITLGLIFLGFGPETFCLGQSVDWGRVDSKKFTLLYPGVASWEFLTSSDHSLGARNINAGKRACPDCHMNKMTGELDSRAPEIASGQLKMKQSLKPFEPNPIPGKKGFLEVTVQAAYDKENLYFRTQWKSSGTSWNNPNAAKEGYPDRIALQINNHPGSSFSHYGCFIACHSDANTMPNSPTPSEVQQNPYYKSLNREDVRLYDFFTRNGNWSKMKTAAELKNLMKEQGITDLWKATIEGKRVKPEDWWIFDDRKQDEKEDVEATGVWENGIYTVVFKRKLQTGDPQDVQFKEGDQFTIGIAVHDEKTRLRNHFVSLPLSVGLGNEGLIRAKKIE